MKNKMMWLFIVALVVLLSAQCTKKSSYVGYKIPETEEQKQVRQAVLDYFFNPTGHLVIVKVVEPDLPGGGFSIRSIDPVLVFDEPLSKENGKMDIYLSTTSTGSNVLIDTNVGITNIILSADKKSGTFSFDKPLRLTHHFVGYQGIVSSDETINISVKDKLEFTYDDTQKIASMWFAPSNTDTRLAGKKFSTNTSTDKFVLDAIVFRNSELNAFLLGTPEKPYWYDANAGFAMRFSGDNLSGFTMKFYTKTGSTFQETGTPQSNLHFNLESVESSSFTLNPQIPFTFNRVDYKFEKMSRSELFLTKNGVNYHFSLVDQNGNP